MGTEKNSVYYDSIYKESEKYGGHYRKTPYYPIWLRLMDWIYSGDKILDIGCGPGQFGNFLFDTFRGKIDYSGIDFSPVAIEKAREVCPYKFFKVNAFMYLKTIHSQAFPLEYTKYILLEFLEHINADLELLGYIPKHSTIIFSVPNFDNNSHVRHFKKVQDIILRYDGLIHITDISHVDVSENNKIFLGRGEKK